MSYLGSWGLGATLTVYLDTALPETGQSQDASALPTYRVYDASTNTPIWQSTMARLDATPQPSVTFTPVLANYVQLVSQSDIFNSIYASCAEFQVFAGATLIPQSQMSVLFVDSQELNGNQSFLATNVLDGNNNTAWHTDFTTTQPTHPHTLQLALGGTYQVSGFFYLPFQESNPTGTIKNYTFSTSMNGTAWGSPVASGVMPLTPSTTSTVGWYVAQVPLLASTGFLPGHRYGVRLQASVAGITGAVHHTFTIAALPATTVTPARLAWRSPPGNPQLTAGGSLTVNPCRMGWQAAAPRMQRVVVSTPSQLAWNASPRHFLIDPQGRRGRLVRRPRRISWRFATRPGLANVVNHTHPLFRGLVSWWLTRGWMTKGWVWYDLVGGNHGRLANMGHSATSGWGGTSRLGGHGEMRFDGVDDYVDIGLGLGGSLDLPQHFTLAAWIYLTSFGGGGLGRLLDKRGAGVLGYALLVDTVTVSQGLSLTLNAGGTYGQNSATTAAGTLTTGQWTHVLVTVAAASTVTFYVNGRPVVQDVGSGVLTETALQSTVPLAFGTAPTRTDRDFEGLLDDIRIWRRVLSAQEAALVYRTSLVGYPGLLQPPHPLWIMVSPAAATVTTARVAWRAATAVLVRKVLVTAGRVGWQAATARPVRVFPVVASRVAWQVATAVTPRGFAGVVPQRMGWRAARANMGQFVRVVPAKVGI